MSLVVLGSELTLDPSDSALLTLPADVTEARIEQPRLRAIDLRSSPALERVDLSGCRSSVWVSIAGCPSLRELALPPLGGGATLHIDFGEGPRALVATGRVRHVDFCWIDPDAPRDDPRRGLRDLAPLARGPEGRAQRKSAVNYQSQGTMVNTWVSSASTEG